jgi:hypothetical protein
MSELSHDDKAILAELLRGAIATNPPPSPQRIDQLTAILEKLGIPPHHG